jgi:hypothetical protein
MAPGVERLALELDSTDTSRLLLEPLSVEVRDRPRSSGGKVLFDGHDAREPTEVLLELLRAWPAAVARLSR